MSQVALEVIPGKNRRGIYGLKDEEYMADFCLVSRRSLSEEDYQIFKYHFLLGADWKLCCRKLGIDRGSFYHQVYRIQERLGRVFKELRPYALFPLDEYFGGKTQSSRQPVAVIMADVDVEDELPFPIKKAA